MLTREQMEKAACNPPPIGTIQVPELGGEVAIRTWSAQDFIDLREANQREKHKGIEGTAWVVSRLLANPDGSAMYREEEASKLLRFGFVLLERIAEEGAALNGIGKKAADDTGKN